MKEGKIAYAEILLHDGEDGTVDVYSFGEDKLVAKMLLRALAKHLRDTAPEHYSNMDLADAVHHDISEHLDVICPEK